MMRDVIPNELNIGNGYTVVYFYTPFCGTCAEAKKMLNITLDALPEKIPAFSCDLNLAPDLARKWKIASVPCLLLFHAGEIEDRAYAFHSTSFLFDFLGRKM